MPAHPHPPPPPPMAAAAATSLLRIRRSPSSLLVLSISLLALLLFLSLHVAVQNLASQTRTLAGHNLDPTPWHPFDKHNPDPSTVFRCSYLTCPFSSASQSSKPPLTSSSSPSPSSCPGYFGWIRRDLEPWRRARISRDLLEGEARRRAAMRVTIVKGRMYVDLYYACVQSRAMFTIWGMLQLLRRYPGRVPDVDIMFDCMDRPSIERAAYTNSTGPPPPPLFRYCTTRDHLDIPFPDWSFWGWSEINIKPWDEEFISIKRGSRAKPWGKKDPFAYWKGNPDVQSPVREALLGCNDTQMWGAKIVRQNWIEEAAGGFRMSQLSSQCSHRYKIYAEGFAWSVSLKYILACGSLSLIIDPLYQDFFTRGLLPKVNFWPISPGDLCQSIKSAVDWGNLHPAEAEAIGKRGQALMEELDMARVYDYMYHLISEYSKLLDFKPSPPSSSQEVCLESIFCLADEKQRNFLERSYTSPSTAEPCSLPRA